MKLRIRANTIRLRLTRDEVSQIGRGEAVEETTEFPDGARFRYALVPGETHDASLGFHDGNVVVRVSIPKQRAVSWAASNEVGFAGDQPQMVGPLALLIEKDFACLNSRDGEDEVDTFTNPNKLHTS